MDVFGYGTLEGTRPLLPPGTCWICENSPQQEAMKVIDTRRNSRAGGVSVAVSERKYVCEPCATELGQAVGLVPAQTYEALQAKYADVADSEKSLAIQLGNARAEQTRVVSLDDVKKAYSEITVSGPSIDVTATVSESLRDVIREELAGLVPKKAPAKKPSAS